jgi:hypothetical protein
VVQVVEVQAVVRVEEVQAVVRVEVEDPVGEEVQVEVQVEAQVQELQRKKVLRLLACNEELWLLAKGMQFVV